MRRLLKWLLVWAAVLLACVALYLSWDRQTDWRNVSPTGVGPRQGGA
jgi:hypothetical protein